MADYMPDNGLRLEIKFVASRVHLSEILGWIRHNPIHFKTSYPQRTVNNIYFDDMDLGAYKENLIGASNRTKVRYRWYGDSITPDLGKLEVKRKKNVFGWKLQFDINKPLYQENASWKMVRQSILKQLPETAKSWFMGSPATVLINRYERQYFESSDRKIRVTVDTGQKVWSQLEKRKPNFKFMINLPDTVVVEFKFSEDKVGLVSQTMQGLPCRATKHSKYVNGLVYGLAN